ncbi:hypothetical protein PsYK624_084630 [Phanerochaete sordida]|uniref:Uncharacterized protein n=1 Tax=Phanerochaete sordida TaxID=48140 RepID=A0A9P3GDF2_9APHY|nr:hypothetical protein PsYK624_084630 [Phanerochaete sordida]
MLNTLSLHMAHMVPQPALSDAAAEPTWPTPRHVPRRRITEEELQQKAEMKQRRKEWEATLRPFVVSDPERGVCFPRGTEVMYLGDAMGYFALSMREAATLPYQLLPQREGTPERTRGARAVVPLASLAVLVQERADAAGVPMPADAPVGVMRCTGTGDAYPCPRKC